MQPAMVTLHCSCSLPSACADVPWPLQGEDISSNRNFVKDTSPPVGEWWCSRVLCSCHQAKHCLTYTTAVALMLACCLTSLLLQWPSPRPPPPPQPTTPLPSSSSAAATSPASTSHARCLPGGWVGGWVGRCGVLAGKRIAGMLPPCFADPPRQLPPCFSVRCSGTVPLQPPVLSGTSKMDMQQASPQCGHGALMAARRGAFARAASAALTRHHRACRILPLPAGGAGQGLQLQQPAGLPLDAARRLGAVGGGQGPCWQRGGAAGLPLEGGLSGRGTLHSLPQVSSRWQAAVPAVQEPRQPAFKLHAHCRP